MNYTVLGSQIPHLSKETHKKTSMTVHLSLKCECSVGKTTPCKHETSYGVQYKSTTCIHSRAKVDPEPHSDLVERGREAPNPKKSRLPVHFSLNCECCTPLRRASAQDSHHLTWHPHPPPLPQDYVQPHGDTSWVEVAVQGCHWMMRKNLRHLLWTPDRCTSSSSEFEIQGSKVCSTIRPLTLGHCFGFFQRTHVWKAPTSTFHQSLVLPGMVASVSRSKGRKYARLSAPSLWATVLVSFKGPMYGKPQPVLFTRALFCQEWLQQFRDPRVKSVLDYLPPHSGPLFWFLSKDPCMESPNQYLSPEPCFARNGCIGFEIQGSKVCSTICPLTLGHCFGFFQGTHVWKAPTSTFHQSLVLPGMVASVSRYKGRKYARLSAPSHRHNKHSWGWKHEWMPTGSSVAVAVHFSCGFQCVQNQKHTKRLHAFWSFIGCMGQDQNIYPPLSPPPEAEPCERPWPWCQGAK